VNRINKRLKKWKQVTISGLPLPSMDRGIKAVMAPGAGTGPFLLNPDYAASMPGNDTAFVPTILYYGANSSDRSLPASITASEGLSGSGRL
jgi:hypothetical protein